MNPLERVRAYLKTAKGRRNALLGGGAGVAGLALYSRAKGGGDAAGEPAYAETPSVPPGVLDPAAFSDMVRRRGNDAEQRLRRRKKVTNLKGELRETRKKLRKTDRTVKDVRRELRRERLEDRKNRRGKPRNRPDRPPRRHLPEDRQRQRAKPRRRPDATVRVGRAPRLRAPQPAPTRYGAIERRRAVERRQG